MRSMRDEPQVGSMRSFRAPGAVPGLPELILPVAVVLGVRL